MKHIDEAIRNNHISVWFSEAIGKYCYVVTSSYKKGSLTIEEGMYINNMSKEYYEALTKGPRLGCVDFKEPKLCKTLQESVDQLDNYSFPKSGIQRCVFRPIKDNDRIPVVKERISELINNMGHESLHTEKNFLIELLQKEIESLKKENQELKVQIHDNLHMGVLFDNKPNQTVEVKLTDSEAFKTLVRKLDETILELESEKERAKRILTLKQASQYQLEIKEKEILQLKEKIEYHEEGKKRLREENSQLIKELCNLNKQINHVPWYKRLFR